MRLITRLHMGEPLRLLAAGSLSKVFAALNPVDGRPVAAAFGASGLLRTRIEDGECWDVFASADTSHPAALHQSGLATAPRVFCHNALSLILRPGLGRGSSDVTTLLRRPGLRLGISTPGNDPSGDYAVEALGRLEEIAPGEGRAAIARAQRLTGAPDLPRAPAGRSTYAWLVTSGAADMFLTYRTGAIAAKTDSPALHVIDLPEPLQVRATYALTTRTGASPAAQGLAERILSSEVQARLATLGFEPACEHHIEGSIP